MNKDDRTLITVMVCIALGRMFLQMSRFDQWGHPGTILFASLCIVWTLAIHKRIIQRNLRFLLEMIGLSLFLLFIEQVMKYDYFDGLIAMHRFLWYSYYIPLILVPLFSFLATLCIGRETGDNPLHIWKWLVPAGLFLILAVLTNDLHRMAFYFTTPDKSESAYVYGILYYIVAFWIATLMEAAFGIALHRCRLYRSRRAAWIPALFLIGGLLLFLLIFAEGGSVVRIGGYTLFQFQEVYCLMLIGFWEACIQIGLIPSNRNYEKLFDLSSLQAQIADDSGVVIHRAAAAGYLTKEQMQRADAEQILSEQKSPKQGLPEQIPAGQKPADQMSVGQKLPGRLLRLRSHSIYGGHVYWVDDLTTINRINEQLADTAEQLGEENTLLLKENQLLEEKVRYETQNRLYDEIARHLRPQLEEIETLIAADSRTTKDSDEDKDLTGFNGLLGQNTWFFQPQACHHGFDIRQGMFYYYLKKIVKQQYFLFFQITVFVHYNSTGNA